MVRDDSVLLEFWQLAYHNLKKNLPVSGGYHERRESYMVPMLSLISLDSILATCLVVEEEPGLHETAPTGEKNEQLDRVILVRDRKQWPNEFTSA